MRKGSAKLRRACAGVTEVLESRLLLSGDNSTIGAWISNDVLLPTAGMFQALKAATPAGAPSGATAEQTSEFMAGTVYVTVVLMESTGSGEDWTPTEISQVKSEITEGLGWWENMFSSRSYVGGLDFQIDFQHADAPFSTSSEPITLTMNEEFTWIDPYLTSQGQAGGYVG